MSLAARVCLYLRWRWANVRLARAIATADRAEKDAEKFCRALGGGPGRRCE